MGIENSIKKEFVKARRRGWNKIYVFVDFHEVIMVPDYQSRLPKVQYYPFAKELLQYLTTRVDVCLVTWTCSHPHQIDSYLRQMKKDKIVFDYQNSNPEVTTDDKYGYYKTKPYYNILLDDKGGVGPEDLEHILNVFKNEELLIQRPPSKPKTRPGSFKFSMYCGSRYPIASHIGYDIRKYPEPPYQLLKVQQIVTSDPRLKITDISISDRKIYNGSGKFEIGSGNVFSVSGIWDGPISSNPTHNLSVKVEFIGELIDV